MSDKYAACKRESPRLKAIRRSVSDEEWLFEDTGDDDLCWRRGHRVVAFDAPLRGVEGDATVYRIMRG